MKLASLHSASDNIACQSSPNGFHFVLTNETAEGRSFALRAIGDLAHEIFSIGMPVEKGRFFALRAIGDLVHEIFSTGHKSFIPIREV